MPDPISRVELHDGYVDVETGQAHREDGVRSLTTMEVKALRFLVERAGTEVSHEDLLEKVWAYAPGVVSRAPYFTIRRLRAKLERDPEAPTLLQTVHGVGYRFVAVRTVAQPAPRAVGNLPAMRPRLFGPPTRIDALVDDLRASRRIGLYGPPGVGKSSVAIAVARAVGGEAWWIAPGEEASPRQAAGMLAAQMGRQASPTDPIDPAEAVRAMWVGRGPVVVVLDDVSPRTADRLAELWLDALPELRMIATHRRRPEGPEAARIAPLSAADGADLLRHVVGKLGRSLPASSQGPLEAISAALDGLPRALELVAPRLVVTAPSRLVGSAQLGAQTGLSGVMADALDHLPPQALSVLTWTASFAGGATLDELVAVSALAEPELLDTLQHLTDRCLVEVREPRPPLDEPRFSAFASFRLVAAGQDDHQERQARVHERVAADAWHWCQRAQEGHADADAHVLDAARNLEQAIRHPPTALRGRLAWDVVLRSTGSLADRQANADAAVALARDTADGFWLSEAMLLRGQVGAGFDDNLADLEQALEHAATPTQSLRAAMDLARHHLFRGAHDAAEPALTAAWGHAQRAQDPYWIHAVLQVRLTSAVYRAEVTEADALGLQLVAHRRAFGLEGLLDNSLAIWHDLRGDRAAMERALDADIARCQRRGDRAREANGWMNKGYLWMHLGRDGASECLQRAVTLAQRAGSRRLEATARLNLCARWLHEGRLLDATAEGLASLALAEALGNDRLAGICRLGLGQVAAADVDGQAVRWLEDAAQIAVRCQDQATAMMAEMLLAPLLHEAGEAERGSTVWASAVERFEEGPQTERFVVALDVHRAVLELCRGDGKAAERLLAELEEGTAAWGLLRAWVAPRVPAP